RIYSLRADVAPLEIALPDTAIALHWEADSRHIMLGGNFQDLLRVDTDSGTVVGTWPGHHAEVIQIAISEHSGTVASGGWDSQVRVWDRHGQPLLAMAIPRPVAQLTFGDDRTLGWANPEGDQQRAMCWHLHEPRVLRAIETPEDLPSRLPWAA